MGWLARIFGLDFGKPAMSVAEMDERIINSSRIDQTACDVINESRRKRNKPMMRCGEGLPSWEGQLTTRREDPSWEGLTGE